MRRYGRGLAVLGALLAVPVALFWRAAWASWDGAAWGLAQAYVLVAGALAIVPASLLVVGGLLWFRGRAPGGRGDAVLAGVVAVVAAGSFASGAALVVTNPPPPQLTGVLRGTVTVTLEAPVAETVDVAVTCRYGDGRVQWLEAGRSGATFGYLDPPAATLRAGMSIQHLAFDWPDRVRIRFDGPAPGWRFSWFDGAATVETSHEPDRRTGHAVFRDLPLEYQPDTLDGGDPPPPAAPALLSGSIDWTCPPGPDPG